MDYLNKKTLVSIIIILVFTTIGFKINLDKQSSGLLNSLENTSIASSESYAKDSESNEENNENLQDFEEVNTKPKEIFVDIDGAVNEPGVYIVEEGTRLINIINIAGGLKDTAETKYINRADIVYDGQKIYIPEKDEDFEPTEINDTTIAGNTQSQSNKININTATEKELETLNGIGEVLAKRIIEYRKTNKFNTIEDIMKVSGIADGKFQQIKDDISVK
jgi:competence protein ComEA